MFKKAKQKDYKYIDVDTLKFEIIDLNFVANEEEVLKKYKALKNTDFKDKLVRCNVKVSFDKVSIIDIDYLKECFKDAYDCNEIIPTIINNNRVRNEEIKSDISDKDAIEKFIDSSNRSDKKEILELIEKELMSNV